MPKYLVCFSESLFEEQEFKIVNASNENEAIDNYIKVFAVTDNNFLTYVYDKSVNTSFAENFWMQTEEEEAIFHETARIIVGDEEFEKRVRTFFSRHLDYAELYLKHYYRDEDRSRVEPFPEEMLVYMYVNSDHGDITAIKLDEIGEI